MRCCIGAALDVYISAICPQKDKFDALLQKLSCIEDILLSFKFPDKQLIATIEEKLEQCLDREHDPSSELYHERDRRRQTEKAAAKKRKYDEVTQVNNVENQLLANGLAEFMD